MGRRGSNRRSLPKKKNMPQKKPVTTQPTVVNNSPASGPTIGQTIGQGVAIGAGAAVGSSMIHGAMDMMSGSKDNNSQQNIPQNNNCKEIFQSYHNCINNYNDNNICKPFMDLYYNCIEKNNI